MFGCSRLFMFSGVLQMVKFKSTTWICMKPDLRQGEDYSVAEWIVQ